MIDPVEVMSKQDGELTKAFYAELNQHGEMGQLAVALFRAQKRSGRAKEYRRGKWRSAAYDVKSWSMSEACRVLQQAAERLGIRWGWKPDTTVLFGREPSSVLYVDLPQGQVSFHSPSRGIGPEYSGEWDGMGLSEQRIIEFCRQAATAPTCPEDKGAIREGEIIPDGPTPDSGSLPPGTSKPLFGSPDWIRQRNQLRRRV